jgi:parvulin-like peptidyl-prolyl isomerase
MNTTKPIRLSQIRKGVHRAVALWIGLWFLNALTLHSEVIDRIAAVVGTQIITQSEVREEHRLKATLGEMPGADNVVLQELIEERLIEDQMVQFPGVEVTEQQIDNELNLVQNRQGLSVDTIRAGIRKRLARIRFFDLRFRQFITADSSEVQQYYDTVFVPEAQARRLSPIPPFSEVADLIRANVINEKLSREVDVWLDAVRGRTNVEVFQ